jgi:hypothetical protein
MLWEGGFSASRHAGAGAFPPDGFAPCRSFPLVAAFRVVTVRCTLCLRCAWEAVRTVGGVGASAFAQLRRALRSLPLRAFCLLRESVLVYSMTECGFRGRTCFLVALRISVALRMILSFQILVSKRLLRLALPFTGSALAGSFGMILAMRLLRRTLTSAFFSGAALARFLLCTASIYPLAFLFDPALVDDVASSASWGTVGDKL